ncbi:MAG: pyruvoyl-dependent arginine decarboxylase [Chitinophagaceae bacterium]|nr:MAG: pyruvoyl-dependent arginine decarboxylase [Chitinophagaceae bacterium]
MKLIPTRYFLTKGIGVHEKQLRSREEALRQAGIETCNLIKISSVIPPGCKRVAREEGLKGIYPGMMTFAVQALSATNEPLQIISAGLGLAQPHDPQLYGYITEIEEMTGIEAGDVAQDVEEMAIENLITCWGMKSDGDDVMRKGKKHYEFDGRKVEVDSLVASAKGNEDRLWTTVIVAAVYLFD